MFIASSLEFCLLFPLVGVDDDGDGAVVHKVDLHVRAELPVLQVFKALMAHLLEEFFIARHGQLAPGYCPKSRTLPTRKHCSKT